MATIKYILQSKKDNSPIYLRFSIGRGKLLKRKTGLNIDYSKWNSKKGYPVNKDETTKTLKIELLKLQSFIEEEYNKSYSKGEIIGGDWLLDKINTHFKRITNKDDLNIFNNVVDNIISNASIRRNAKNGLGISESRIKSYKNLKNTIAEYQKNKPLIIKTIDLDFIEKFKSWMMVKKEYSESHTLKRIADIKTVCSEAEKLNIETNIQYKYIKTKQATNNKYIIYFTKEELDKIYNTSMPSEKLENAKKWLLLGCEVGQRGGDLLKITKNNISNLPNNNTIQIITLIQQKTQKKVVVPISPRAQLIIENGLPRPITLQKLNKYVKEVCEISKINDITKGRVFCDKKKRKIEGEYPKWKLVGSHICRRTFATQHYGNMNTTVLRTLTAHSSEKMLLEYIGKKAEDFTEDAYLSMLEQYKK